MLSKKSLLLVIFITAFIDMLGIGIIIPVIPSIFFSADSSFFAADISYQSRSILFGLLLASYPLMQFFGAPILGALSDRYGRKPILRLALIGSLIGYLLFAYGLSIGNIYLLFVSRLLPGFMGGNTAILMSSIADISDHNEKSRNFALIGLAFGLGFVLGPSIGGVLADNSLVSWFNHQTPFWFTSGLTLLNIILLQFIFVETLKQKKYTVISALTGLKNIVRSFKDPKLKRIFSIVLLLSLGFAFFTQFFSVFLIEKYNYSEKDIGFLYGWIGIWLVITQGGIVRRLSYKYTPRVILQYSIVLIAIGLFLLLLPDTPGWFYIINPIIAIGHGITGPNLTTLVSNNVGSQDQGHILGINQSMQSLGRTLPPIIAGYLNTINTSLPILVAGFLCICAWVMYLVLDKYYQKES